jgi:hypothetical protein
MFGTLGSLEKEIGLKMVCIAGFSGAEDWCPAPDRLVSVIEVDVRLVNKLSTFAETSLMLVRAYAMHKTSAKSLYNDKGD